MIRETLRTLRETHPGWGPQTLRLELSKALGCKVETLPSRARIAAWLHEAQLTRGYQRHTTLEEPSAPRRPTTPHEEWELDAQGVQSVQGVGAVTLINVADGYSRLKVESWGCIGCRKPATADYQLACRRAFLRYGRPQRISLDHDTVFYDSNCASPFPSRLHLWLLALGIEVVFITQPPPTAHATIERTHQLLTQQALAGQTFGAAQAMQPALDARREFLNTEYPSRTWQGRPPLTACPQAQHSLRSYTPETEIALLDLSRIYAYLARQHWFRQVSQQGQFSLGGYIYHLEATWARQTIELTFDPDTQEFVCTSADGQRTHRLPTQGLRQQDLVGELPPWDKLPVYQRRLPLTPATVREDVLYQDQTGMIL